MVLPLPLAGQPLVQPPPGRRGGGAVPGRLADGDDRRGQSALWVDPAALTIAQADTPARVITVDREIVEVAGHLYLEAPKNRKYRRTIYPQRTPGGYPLAARAGQARAEQQAGTNPLGLVCPGRRGGYWRSSNFNRRILQPAYLKAGWRGPGGNGTWSWHSLRHVFCPHTG